MTDRSDLRPVSGNGRLFLMVVSSFLFGLGDLSYFDAFLAARRSFSADEQRHYRNALKRSGAIAYMVFPLPDVGMDFEDLAKWVADNRQRLRWNRDAEKYELAA